LVTVVNIIFSASLWGILPFGTDHSTDSTLVPPQYRIPFHSTSLSSDLFPRTHWPHTNGSYVLVVEQRRQQRFYPRGGEPNPPACPTTLLNKEATQSYGQFRELPGVGQGGMQKERRWQGHSTPCQGRTRRGHDSEGCKKAHKTQHCSPNSYLEPDDFSTTYI